MKNFFTQRIMIIAMQMKIQILVFPGQKTVHVVLVEKDREKTGEDREKRDEVGETEDEIGRKQEGIDVIKKKMIHLKNNCQSVDEKHPVRNRLERKISAVEEDITLSKKMSKKLEIVNFFGAVESNVKRSSKL